VCYLPCDLPLPTDGRSFHLHGSPPCQKFSSVNKNKGGWKNKQRSVDLVEWYLEYALASRATSWSMEQVAAPEVLCVLERVLRKNSSRMAYSIFHFSKLGVPQSRRRVIAGSPQLIAKLIGMLGTQPASSIRSVLARPRGTHIRGGTTASGNHTPKDRISIFTSCGVRKLVYKRAKWSDYCYPIDGLAPTVIGRHALVWVTGNGEGCNRSVLRPSEMAALQTFPPHYKLPTSKFQAYLQVGNAFPPRVAELMLRDDSTTARSAVPR